MRQCVIKHIVKQQLCKTSAFYNQEHLEVIIMSTQQLSEEQKGNIRGVGDCAGGDYEGNIVTTQYNVEDDDDHDNDDDDDGDNDSDKEKVE